MQRRVVAGISGPISVLESGLASELIPAVFIHGINGAAVQWTRTIDALVPPRRCIAPDLRGHGDSHRNGPFEMERYIDEVIELVSEPVLERFHIVGTSLGGAIAAGVALACPDRVVSWAAIGSAMATSGVGSMEDRIGLLRRVGVEQFFTERLPLASFGPSASPELVAEAVAVASHDREVEVVAQVLVGGFGADNTEIFSSVTAPALICTGEDDLTCSVSLGQALADQVGSRLTVLPGVGHLAILEDPASVAAALNRHFAHYDR